jgi:hypothetical protein
MKSIVRYNTFRLSALFIFLFHGFLAAQSITVSSPTAGAVICKGKTITISWIKTGAMDAMVKVRLYDAAGTKMLGIVEATPNSGSFNWSVPASVADGQYTVRLRTLDNAVLGESQPFTIRSCLGDGIVTKPGPGNVVVPPPQIGNVTTPQPNPVPAVTLNRDFDLKSVGWTYGGGLYAVLGNNNGAPFNGVLTFRIKAIGHDLNTDIPVSLPQNGESRVDLVFMIQERDLFDFGGRDTVAVTVNPNRLYNETNFSNNTKRHTCIVQGINAWVDRLELKVQPARNHNGPYPIVAESTVTMVVKGIGRLRVDVDDSRVGFKSIEFDVNSPNGYTTYTKSVSMAKLEESVIKHPLAPTRCGPKSYYCPWKAKLRQSANPNVRGVLVSNVVDGCYTYD